MGVVEGFVSLPAFPLTKIRSGAIIKLRGSTPLAFIIPAESNPSRRKSNLTTGIKTIPTVGLLLLAPEIINHKCPPFSFSLFP